MGLFIYYNVDLSHVMFNETFDETECHGQASTDYARDLDGHRDHPRRWVRTGAFHFLSEPEAGESHSDPTRIDLGVTR